MDLSAYASGLVLDLDPNVAGSVWEDSAGTTTAGEVGNPVGRINDQSGSTHDFTQGTTAAKPTLREDANGFKYLEFDGSDDLLVGPRLDDDGSNAFTVLLYMTYQGSSPATGEGFWAHGNTGLTGRSRTLQTDGSWFFGDGEIVYQDVPSEPTVVIGHGAAGATYGEHELVYDGVTQSSTGSTNPTTVPDIRDIVSAIGVRPSAGIYARIDATRVIFWDRQLSGAEIVSISTEMKAYYSGSGGSSIHLHLLHRLGRRGARSMGGGVNPWSLTALDRTSTAHIFGQNSRGVP